MFSVIISIFSLVESNFTWSAILLIVLRMVCCCEGSSEACLLSALVPLLSSDATCVTDSSVSLSI